EPELFCLINILVGTLKVLAYQEPAVRRLSVAHLPNFFIVLQPVHKVKVLGFQCPQITGIAGQGYHSIVPLNTKVAGPVRYTSTNCFSFWVKETLRSPPGVTRVTLSLSVFPGAFMAMATAVTPVPQDN